MRIHMRRIALVLLVGVWSQGAGSMGLAQKDPSRPEVAKNGDSDDPNSELIWRREGEAADYSRALDLQQGRGERPKVLLKKFDASGQVAAVRDLSGFDQKMFIGPDVYTTRLHPSVRGDYSYVHIVLSGTVKLNPDEGTIFNIDGAILGFSGSRDPETHQGLARIMRLDGEDSWVSTGVSVLLNPRDDLSGPTKLCVRLHPDKSAWDLFVRDMLVAENLPLFGSDGPPVLSVRAGVEDADSAILRDFGLHTGTPGRQAHFLPSVDGRIDVAKAHRDGSPWVEKFEQPAPGGDQAPER